MSSRDIGMIVPVEMAVMDMAATIMVMITGMCFIHMRLLTR